MGRPSPPPRRPAPPGEGRLLSTDEAIEQARQKVLRREKVLRSLHQARIRLEDEQKHYAELRGRLRLEEKDVRDLERGSLTRIIVSMLGTLERRLEKERQEAAAARLKAQDSAELLEALRLEIQGLATEVDSLSDAEDELEKARRGALTRRAAPNSRAEKLADAQARMQAQIREIDEARKAGRELEAELKALVNVLGLATSWSAADLFIGGLGGTLISLAKHREIDDARDRASRVRRLADRFGRELRDVEVTMNLPLDSGPFLRFADIFWDNFLADVFVAAKIDAASREASFCLARVTERLQALEEKGAAHQRAVRALIERQKGLS